MDDRKGQIMFMTEEERELRKNLRLKLEEIANRNKLFDNHGNEIKAIHITDVMRLILEEDVEILELLHNIKQLTKIRTERTLEDLSNNFDESDRLLEPDDKTKEAFKSREILKRDKFPNRLKFRG